MRIKQSWIAVAAAGWVGVLLAGAGVASATSEPVDPTRSATAVTVTGADELTALNIGLSTNAPIDGIGRYVFQMSGGIWDQVFLDGVLEHQPALGITLTAGATTLELNNFVIDTSGVEFLLFADATTTPGGPDILGLPLFSLTFCNAPAVFGSCVNNDGSYQIDGYGLLVTSDAAAAIGAAFGIDASSLIDTQFGIANIKIATVPEPGTLVLAGFGLAGLAARARRRAA